jgi:Kef-type K+ transport system membrane component KefB
MEILVALLVVLVVTRAFGEIAIRLGQPALVGELISGIALGLALRQYTDASPLLDYYSSPAQPAVFHLADDPVFVALTDLGIFFLMLHGGIELRAGDLAKASWRALLVAVCGLVLPLAIGFGIGWGFLPKSEFKVAQCLFVGTALAITAVPVTIRVLMDLGKLDSAAGSIIVSAAIFDDILSLLLLAILTAVIDQGQFPDAAGMAALAGNIVLFFAATVLIGRFAFPSVGRILRRFETSEFEFTALVVVALAFAVLAELMGLHFILGAFIAGLFFENRVAGSATYDDVQRKVSAVTMGFLAPLFFASIGLHLDLSAVTTVPVFLTLLIACAFLSKLVGAGVPAYWTGLSKRDALAVGVGMSGRGAVELIIAGIALRAGLFSQPDPAPPVIANMFSAVVIVAIVTTVAVPVLLKFVFDSVDDETSMADS